jgi:hypothetical protein
MLLKMAVVVALLLPSVPPDSGRAPFSSGGSSPSVGSSAEPKVWTCPKKKANTTGGGHTITGAGSQTCGNGASCGQTDTYNPPGTSSCATVEEEVCCLLQAQKPYTQTWSCVDINSDGVTECVAGPKNYLAGTTYVYVTVACLLNSCDQLPDY